MKQSTVIILAVAVSLLALSFFLCGIGIGFWIGDANTSRDAQPETAAPMPKQRIPRGEFREKIMGMTQQQVLAAFGKPDSTQDFGPDDINWYYTDRTYDPVTNKTDSMTQVVFEGGKVVKVNF